MGAAVRVTMATAGRALAVSGVMVALALSTLLGMHLSFMTSMGIGGVLIPLTSLAAVLTALPALLGVLGPRVDWLPVLPRRYRLSSDGPLWTRLAHAIMARPLLAALGVLALLLALALPAAQLKTGFGGGKNSPDVQFGARVPPPA